MSSRVPLGLVFLTAGVLWLLAAADVVDISYQVWIGVLLVAIGIGIAFVPGRHGLLVVLGVVVAIAGIPALVVDSNVYRGGIGDSVEAPATPVDVEPYSHGIGKLTVDLRSPALEVEDLSVRASIGVGELLVLVPVDADVSVDAQAAIGSIDAFGVKDDGISPDLELELDRGGTGTSAHRIDLDLSAGIGSIRIVRRD
jgi:predicted membrane protein